MLHLIYLHFGGQSQQLERKAFFFHCQGPRADGLKQKRDRHKFHIKHLEMAMRAVDNDALGVEQVWLKTTQ